MREEREDDASYMMNKANSASKPESITIIEAELAGLSAGCYSQINGRYAQIFGVNAKPGSLHHLATSGDGGIHWLTGSSLGSIFYRLWIEVGEFKGGLRLITRFMDRLKVIQVEGPKSIVTSIAWKGT